MNDKDLKCNDIQTLSSREGIASFFAILSYDTEAHLPQTATALGITAASLQRQIKNIEQLAVQDDGAEPLYVYLVELTSVTIAATQSLARAFRNRMGNYLLVLTNDYERIDFVLLERILPQLSSSNFSQSQVSVMPRTLTVNRRNPSKVDLRVLRRFTCTEADSDAQYDKLLSAYTIAEWSEPLFNNRALFSDYYLNERLPDLPEWQDRPETIYHRFRALFTDFRANLAADSQTTKQNLLEPAFNALGFHAIPADDSSEERADYSLFTPSNSEKPIAACLAYNWNRYLDGHDETRDTDSPEENPGARVVTILESGEVPWAIVTNGKLWRLYSARTHSRATNYYEIDLEETLAMDDSNNEAFRYFYLFFRAAAFVPEEQIRDGQPQQICFLDKLLEESETYAKGLGDRLKERVFDQVFPHFAEGFIEHLKRQPGIADPQQKMLFPVVQQLSLKQEPNETFRRLVFEGTLILLYRLLFLLYAEARGLLPVREQRGYYEYSLTRLKEDIAEKAGKICDEAPTNLDTAYRTDTTDLYDRLMKLFATIDRGSRELNVPLYNGGLFITEPLPEDSSSEAETARFLQKNKIPDRYLAKGLDLLTRDLDDKRQDLVFIDYKSLGVRQLGSIYEGLLEFKIRIASEKMAVVKGKRTEEVIPYKEAKKVLTIGRGHNAQERVYQPGDVYLENDRRERKATGSYYTPEHIVKYILENTVGPVLEEKFEKLRPKFRQAQERYHKKLQQAEVLKKQGLRPDDPNKVANTYQSLVDELFDLRVLDPAMGSGHFLVETVDFICDCILGEREGFLRAFPWNPVTTFLDNTRQAIISEMERQRVSFDTSRLTDINLLKRHVLKRCVYGVDLNPMAVELAKVSLWLDCFTIGAPLSFLDHHLKCGNSLIGTTVQEVQAELANRNKGHVADLFGGPFQGLLAGTATIEKLRRIPDATAAEIENSRNLFTDFEQSQAPYKTALNIWVSRDYNNKFAEEYLTLSGSNLVEQIRPEGRSTLPPKYRETVDKAAEIHEKKGFFHWDLEFPEAFVDLKGGRWKSRDEQGFDVVVGNPPYINVKRGIKPDFSNFAKARYRLASGQWDMGELFYEQALGALLKTDRPVGLIVPKPFFLSENYEKFRDMLICSFDTSDYAPCGQCFPDAGVEAAVAVVWKRNPTNSPVSISDGRNGNALLPYKQISKPLIRNLPFMAFSYLVDPEFMAVLLKGRQNGNLTVLGDVVSWTRGAEVGKRDKSIVESPMNDTYPVIFGETAEAYVARNAGYIKPDRDAVSKFKKHSLYTTTPKLILRRVASLPIAAVDTTGAYVLNTLYVAHSSARYDPFALTVVLNSTVLRAAYRQMFNSDDELFPYIRISQINHLPIPLAALRDPTLIRFGRQIASDKQALHGPLRQMAETRVAELYGASKMVTQRLMKSYVYDVEVK